VTITVRFAMPFREIRVMSRLTEIEQDILARGKVDGEELRALRRRVYAEGKVDRQTANLLVELHKRVQHRTPAFEKFFYRAIKDHILADGGIDAERAAWLWETLFADGRIKDEDRKFLHEVKGEAMHVSRSFEMLFKESMKQPPEQRTSGG
jgi:hypothetical protein